MLRSFELGEALMNIYTQYSSLKNKRVLITGGATGIGAELVKAFAQQHAQVGFIDIDHIKAEELVSELSSQTHCSPWFRKVNVSDTNKLKTTVDEFAAQFSGIDILINNVANDIRHSPEDITEQEWFDCMQLNLNSTFFASQAALSHIKKNNKGAIINFSSLNVIIGPANMVGYTTAKAGIIGMTKSLAKDYGDFNIRVNAILPGWVATERQLNSWFTQSEEKKWQAQMAIKKRIYPHDIAKLALFLASDDSEMITGQSLNIDGGRSS
jgi:NAD(P)-dependent dehydrogenase (short-subunit alcohol dehydrogenase family)